MVKRKADKAFEIVSLGRASYASHSAIDRLLKEVKQNGIPDTFDRSAQHRARLEVCNTLTPYGTLTTKVEGPLRKGGHQPITFQNPLAWFHLTVVIRNRLRRLLRLPWINTLPHSPNHGD